MFSSFRSFGIRTFVLAIAVGSIGAAFHAHADEPRTEVGPSGMTSDSLALLRIDVQAMDAAALLSFLEPFVPEPAKAELNLASMVAQGITSQLRTAGVGEAFVVLSASDLWRKSFILIPCSDALTVANLFQMATTQFPPEVQYVVHQEKGWVWFAAREVIDKYKSTEKDETAFEKLLQSLRSQIETPSDQSHRIAIQIPDRLRNDFSLLLPLNKATPVGNIPLRQLSVDVIRTVLDFRLPPQIAVDLHLTCADAPATDRTHDTITTILQQLPDEIETIKVPKATVSTVGNVLTVSMGSPELVPFISNVLIQLQLRAQSMEVSNQLKQIGLAIHSYHDQHQYLPPKYSVTPEGARLLSWRVHLLPFLGEEALYKEFHLGEPWDSEHNKKLIARMPAFYGVGTDGLPPGSTRIQFPMIENSLWFGQGPPRKLSDITDGLSNTIIASYCDKVHASTWTQPDDYLLTDSVINTDATTHYVLLADGSVNRLPTTVTLDRLRPRLTHASGDIVED